MAGVSSHGTMIKMGSGGSAGAEVSTATSELGTPHTIINSAAHGLVDGSFVTISAVTGTDAQAIVGTWRIEKVNAAAFIIDVATVGNGTGVTYTPLAESFTTIANCKDITLPSAATDEIDVTCHDSAAKETIDGDTDYGSVTFDINYNPANATHAALRLKSETKASTNWQAVLVDTTTETWEFAGWVKGFALSAPVSGVYTASVDIKVTGMPQVG